MPEGLAGWQAHQRSAQVSSGRRSWAHRASAAAVSPKLKRNGASMPAPATRGNNKVISSAAGLGPRRAQEQHMHGLHVPAPRRGFSAAGLPRTRGQAMHHQSGTWEAMSRVTEAAPALAKMAASAGREACSRRRCGRAGQHGAARWPASPIANIRWPCRRQPHTSSQQHSSSSPCPSSAGRSPLQPAPPASPQTRPAACPARRPRWRPPLLMPLLSLLPLPLPLLLLHRLLLLLPGLPPLLPPGPLSLLLPPCSSGQRRRLLPRILLILLPLPPPSAQPARHPA